MDFAEKVLPTLFERDLRQQNGNRTGGDADVQCNITSVVAHDLNDRAAVMTLGGPPPPRRSAMLSLLRDKPPARDILRCKTAVFRFLFPPILP